MAAELRDRLQSSLGSTYTVERELGGGGMSRVFVAEETSLGRKVVVKVLPPELAADVNVERFRREIHLAAQLQHPHIVPLLNAAESGGLLYYSMPLIDGESLRARLAREGELPIEEAVRILIDVADALCYAHEQGVVHRDIKPDNVLLSRAHAVVADFGVAKALSAAAPQQALTSTGLVLGTPAYMAPEQAAGDPHIDRRADLYALGIVAYEILTGQAPFAGRPPQALVAAHLTEEPELVTKRRAAIPAPLAQLVMRLLEKRPADRPQAAEEVVAVLRAVSTPTATLSAAGVPASAESGRAVSSPRVSDGTSRRRRRQVLLVAAGLGVAAVIAAATLALRQREPAPAPGTRRVAVAPFENLTGDPSLDHVGRVASDWLAQGIVQADSVDAVSSAAVAMALGDARQPPADLLRRLNTAAGAGLVVAGSYVLRGADSVQIRAQVLDARTGEVRSSLEPTVGPVNDPGAAIDALRERLLSALVTRNVMASTLRAAPPKYSAYREFVAGQDRFQREFDMRGARPYFERAIALDSTFGLAYNLLALTYMNTGQWDQADSVVRRLDGLRHRLPPDGLLQLDGLHAILRGDLEARLRNLGQIVARDSNPVFLFLTGATAAEMLRPRVGVPALERSDSLMVAAGAVMQPMALAGAYHEAGAHEAELRTALEARRMFPVPTPLARRLLEHQLRAYAGLRGGTEAIALADTILRGITEPAAVLAEFVITGALEFRAHGDPATARRLLDMVRQWYAEHPVATSTPGRLLTEGLAFYLTSQMDSAQSRFARAARDTLNLHAAGYLALVMVEGGDSARAAVVADSLGALPRKWLFGRHTQWRAAILGALGERERAVQLLRQASREGASMESWHYLAALDALRGYPPFEELIRPQR